MFCSASANREEAVASPSPVHRRSYVLANGLVVCSCSTHAQHVALALHSCVCVVPTPPWSRLVLVSVFFHFCFPSLSLLTSLLSPRLCSLSVSPPGAIAGTHQQARKFLDRQPVIPIQHRGVRSNTLRVCFRVFSVFVCTVAWDYTIILKIRISSAGLLYSPPHTHSSSHQPFSPFH